MRLTCPSCAAQYEVPPDAIPPTGRDVQCSACGHTWFEQPPESAPRLLDPDASDGVPRVEGDEEEADDLAELRATDLPPDPGSAMMPDEPPPRSRVPPEVERILREEAQRESEARAEEALRRAAPGDAEPPPAEPPPSAPMPRRLRPRDLSEDPAPEPGLRPPPPEAESPPTPVRPRRPARQVEREIDLDRINSTLRSQADQLGTKAPQLQASPRRRRSGFGGGFLGTLLILAVLAGLYLYRPQIVTALPRTAAILDPYARAVGTGRDWLDRQVARVLGADVAAE